MPGNIWAGSLLVPSTVTELICDTNEAKQVTWCEQQLKNNERFTNLIFSDECTVQLDHHRRLSFRKKKQLRKLKPCAKHPAKVNMGEGYLNSWSNAAGNLHWYHDCSQILHYLRNCFASFPDSHRYQQDNDPKHCANYTKNFFEENNVNWWRTPPESPNLNPIENIWGSMKNYLQHQYKPRDLDSLVEGIGTFWKSLTPKVCDAYIKLLHKVIPRVIAVDGAASGY